MECLIYFLNYQPASISFLNIFAVPALFTANGAAFEEQRPIPALSERGTLKTEPNEFVNYVACDTMAYRKKFSNKAVKKTLTLPEWMNDEAISLGLNFSQILQEALLQKFHT